MTTLKSTTEIVAGALKRLERLSGTKATDLELAALADGYTGRERSRILWSRNAKGAQAREQYARAFGIGRSVCVEWTAASVREAHEVAR